MVVAVAGLPAQITPPSSVGDGAEPKSKATLRRTEAINVVRPKAPKQKPGKTSSNASRRGNLTWRTDLALETEVTYGTPPPPQRKASSPSQDDPTGQYSSMPW